MLAGALSSQSSKMYIAKHTTQTNRGYLDHVHPTFGLCLHSTSVKGLHPPAWVRISVCETAVRKLVDVIWCSHDREGVCRQGGAESEGRLEGSGLRCSAASHSCSAARGGPHASVCPQAASGAAGHSPLLGHAPPAVRNQPAGTCFSLFYLQPEWFSLTPAGANFCVPHVATP